MDRKFLQQKVKVLNFSESAIVIMISFISNRLKKTIVNNIEPNLISLHQGAPQDTASWPLGLICISTS